MTKKKILIVDDDPVNNYLLADLLTGYDTVSVNNIHDMYQLIQSDFIPDLILLDVMLPEVDGFAAARRLKKEFQMKHIPIVFVSARTEGTSVREGFESGGSDYIKKPFDNDELFARIHSVFAQSERETYLRKEASTDPLTGLCNRRSFFATTESKISFCQRKNINLSIAIIDIDFFKNINDTYSHVCGDTLLQQFSNLMIRETRDYDLIGRYGGEEFILSFIDCSCTEAAKILTRLQDTVRTTEFNCEDTPVHITFSAGITDITSCAERCSTLVDYVRVADARLYEAKENGRDRICFC